MIHFRYPLGKNTWLFARYAQSERDERFLADLTSTYTPKQILKDGKPIDVPMGLHVLSQTELLGQTLMITSLAKREDLPEKIHTEMEKRILIIGILEILRGLNA